MNRDKLDKLLEIIKTNPESKEAKSALAELDFLQTTELLRYNKSITIFTIVVGIATVVQTILAIMNYKQ